jgi:UDP-hydrolysing UDP-N-acetyl-D-glucosamine 2-epimerase
VRNVCVVITARPSYSRIKSALRAIRDSRELRLQLVVGASALLSRYGDTAAQIRRDGFTIDAEVFFILEGENPATSAKSTGLGIVELTTLFSNLKPDVVVTVADRFETIATAIAASYLNIPVAHVQGGEVTGSIDEKVRHAVTKLSDLHCVANETSAERVIRMGERPDTVHVTGCPSIDLAAEIMESPAFDFDPFARYGGVGAHFDCQRDYLIVMQHPVTTEYGAGRGQIEQTLAAVTGLRMPAFWFWPNVDAGSDDIAKGVRIFRETNQTQEHIHFFRSMSPEDFLRLLANAGCIVGNSSSGIREASFLGIPCVNIGTRQRGRERGPNVVDVEYDADEIMVGIQHQLSKGRYPSAPVYGDGRAGQRIGGLLARAELRTEKRLTY